MSKHTLTFNSRNLLKRVGTQKTTREYQDRQAIYSQGDAADAMFQIQNGNVKLVVASPRGKQAVIAILGPGDVFGEGCLVNQSLRNINRNGDSVIHHRLRKKGNSGSPNPSRSCLCQALYLLSAFPYGSSRRRFRGPTLQFQGETPGPDSLDAYEFWQEGRAGRHFPESIRNSLAQMVGTTRSRVSHFMNKFRKLGLVDYHGNGALTVHRRLLSAVFTTSPSGKLLVQFPTPHRCRVVHHTELRVSNSDQTREPCGTDTRITRAINVAGRGLARVPS